MQGLGLAKGGAGVSNGVEWLSQWSDRRGDGLVATPFCPPGGLSRGLLHARRAPPNLEACTASVEVAPDVPEERRGGLDPAGHVTCGVDGDVHHRRPYLAYRWKRCGDLNRRQRFACLDRSHPAAVREVQSRSIAKG